MLPAVNAVLKEISESCDANNGPIANGLITIMEKSEFLISLAILRRIFGISLTASLKLQSKTMDLLRGFELIEILYETLTEIRVNNNENFLEIFQSSVEFAQILNCEISIPRLNVRQLNRGNILA